MIEHKISICPKIVRELYYTLSGFFCFVLFVSSAKKEKVTSEPKIRRGDCPMTVWCEKAKKKNEQNLYMSEN